MRHAVLGMKMNCFCEGHNASSGLEPREKNSCVEVSNACVLMRAGSVWC